MRLEHLGNNQMCTKIAGVPKLLVLQIPKLASLKTIGFDTLLGAKESPKRVPTLLCAPKVLVF